MISSLMCELHSWSWHKASLQPLRWIFLAAWLVGYSQADEMTLSHTQLINHNYTIGKPITIGVVWDSREGEFLSGAILAAEEINASSGVNGRAIELKYLDETPYMEQEQVQRSKEEGRYRNGMPITGMLIAKTILSNPEISVVIGHSNPEITLSSLITYQKNDILFLGARTDPQVMWVSENNYFQLLPSNELLAKAITAKLKAKNWDNVYFIYESNRRYEQISELIKTELSMNGMSPTGEIAVMRHMLNATYASNHMPGIAEQIREKKTNAIVIIAGPRASVEIIRIIRAFGVLLPFFGISDLDNQDFIKMVGEDGLNTRIVSPRNSGYQYSIFEKKFQKRFPDKKIDVLAAQGYDSVFLYADAVAIGDNVTPFLVGHVLSVKLPLWYGVLGTYIFKDRVNIGLNYHVLRLVREKDGNMRFVPDDE